MPLVGDMISWILLDVQRPVRCLKNSYVAPQVHIARTFLPFKVLYELHRHESFALLFWSLKPPQINAHYDHITLPIQ
jgi:hypothetical protein